MKILVINAGSSSIKYQLLDMGENGNIIAKGLCERIGIGGMFTHKLADGRVLSEECEFPTHKEAFQRIVDALSTGGYSVVKSMDEISAIGHRIVQGGEKFKGSVLVTDEYLKLIEDFAELAPLHNPAEALAIHACRSVFGMNTPQVAVFDTAFHQTMPEKAYIFGIPYEYYEKYNIRRYGAHGTSHRYVSSRLAKLLGKPLSELKVVSCHIGNGSSITAIDGGKSVDTSMGFTPLDGIIMGTRSGAVDPSVLTYIMEKENLSPAQMNDILNKKSGYIGISGLTSDDRDLRAAAPTNMRAALAGNVQRYQIKKLVGAYAAAMGGIDALIFTGGIGENSIPLRHDVCERMRFIGIEMDEEANIRNSGAEGRISSEASKVEVWIVPTNEEYLIAEDTMKIVKDLIK